MTLQDQVIEVPIVGGVEGNTEGQKKTRLDLLENGLYVRVGGISKRFGTKQLVPATTAQIGIVVTAPQVPETIAPYLDDCIRIGKGELSTYSKQVNTAQNGQRLYRDQVSEADTLLDVVAGAGKVFMRPDMAIGTNGLAVYVFQDRALTTAAGGQVYATIIDTTTGATLQDRFNLSTTADVWSHVRVVAIGNTAIVVFGDSSSPGSINAKTLDLTNIAGGWSVVTALASDAYRHANFDAIFDVAATASQLLVGYVVNGAPVHFKLLKVSTALAVVSSVSSADATPNSAETLSILTDNTSCWMAFSYVTGGNDKTRISRFAVAGMTEDVAPVDVYSIASASEQSQLIGMAKLGSNIAIIAQTANQTLWSQLVSATTFSSALSARRVQVDTVSRLLSKPWVQDGKVFAMVSTKVSATTGGHIFLVDLGSDRASYANMPLRVVSNVCPRQMYFADYLETHCTLAKAVNTATDTWLVPVYGSFGGDITIKGSSIAVLTHRFNPPRQTTQANELAIISGGVPQCFDGRICYEIGFLDTPRLVSIAVTAGGGSLTAGVYSVRWCYEWIDCKGNVVKSAPSPELTSTAAATNDRLTYTFRNLGWSAKADAENRFLPAIVHRAYRTDSGGSTLRSVVGAPPYTATLNSPNTTGTVTFVDGTADATVDAYPLLYTQDSSATVLGELQNDCPPSARYVCTHRRRIVFAGTPDDTMYISKPLAPYVSPEFSDTITIEPFEGGRVQGIASLEDLLIVFKSDGIWYFQGDAADATGQNSTLSEPRRIPSDVGCIESRSIVLTPDGLMFLTRRGYYLLTRGLQVVFIGNDVSDKTQVSGVTITSAVIVPGRNLVRCSRSTGANANDDVLVYDYVNRCWSVDKYYDTYQAAQRGAISACCVAGVYRFVTPEGQEYEEDTTTYLDAGTQWVTQKFRTAHIPIAGVKQGIQRVRKVGVLGEWKSAHQLKVTVTYDYGAVVQAADQFAEVVTNVIPERVMAFAYERPKCAAVQITVEDIAGVTPGTGQGAIINSICIEAGVKRGMGHGLAAAAKG